MMKGEHDAAAPLASMPAAQDEHVPDILFCSPDRARAQRVVMRLRKAGSVRWEASASAATLVQAGSQASLVLMDFAADAIARSSELARQLGYLAPDLPLIAVGSAQGDTAGVIAALRAGVRDFIDLDGHDDEALAAIRKALAQPRLPAAVTATRTHKGRTIVLLGVRAGVGTSTLAAHLGAVSHLQRGRREAEAGQGKTPRTLLLDLGRPEGDAQLYLNVRGEFHFDDAVRNAYRFDATLARTALPHHASGLAVLSRKASMPATAGSGQEATLLAERLRGLFDVLLVDLGGLGQGELPSGFIQAADEIWLVADQGVGTVVSLDEALQGLQRLGVRRHLLQLIVNRYDSDCGITPRQIAERFSLPLLATLPDRSHSLRTSANLGRLLHEQSPHDRYLRALAPLLRRMAPEREPERAASPGRWLRLIRRMGGSRWIRP